MRAEKDLAALNDELVVEIGEGFSEDLLIQITGTFTATHTFQGTVDGTNYVALMAEDVTAGTSATTSTGAGIYRIKAAGFRKVSVKRTAHTSGTAAVTVQSVRS